MGIIQLNRPGVTLSSHIVERFLGYENVDVHASAVAFEAGDLVSFVPARNAWGKAVAADEGAATTILRLALDNNQPSPYRRPFDRTATINGKDDGNKFRTLKLTEVDLHLNVNINTTLLASHIGSAFGLLFDATSGIMTVNLANTTNQHFLILGLSNPTDPVIGGALTVDQQQRVRGRLVSSRT